MNDINIINKIRQTLTALDKMPYGVVRKLHTIPPSIPQYERLINDLINYLLTIDLQNINLTIDKLISIRDNQVRELKLKKNENFYTYDINSEMEDINHLIHMHIDDLLA